MKVDNWTKTCDFKLKSTVVLDSLFIVVLNIFWWHIGINYIKLKIIKVRLILKYYFPTSCILKAFHCDTHFMMFSDVKPHF